MINFQIYNRMVKTKVEVSGNGMFDYQRTNRFFAQISDEMEELGVEELERLKARNIHPVYRGIYFEADLAALYAINYTSRTLRGFWHRSSRLTATLHVIFTRKPRAELG